jgi:hypothetical protein
MAVLNWILAFFGLELVVARTFASIDAYVVATVEVRTTAPTEAYSVEIAPAETQPIAPTDTLYLSAVAVPDTSIPKNSFDLVISLDQPEYLYFLGFELGYEDSALTVDSIAGIGLFEQELAIWDPVGKNRLGASLSRTSGSASPGSGEIARLRFTAKATAGPGTYPLVFFDVLASDSTGNPFVISLPDTVNFELIKAMTKLEFTSFPSGDTLEVTEGDSIPLQALVNAFEITNDIQKQNQITVEIGQFHIDSTGSDSVAGWPESAWSAMEFDQVSPDLEDVWVYRAEAAYRKDPGHYVVALRATLAAGDVFYGAIDGFLAPESGGLAGGSTGGGAGTPRLGFVKINPLTPGRHVIASWNFEDQTLLPNDGLPVNLNQEVGITGAKLKGYSLDPSNKYGYAASSDGWHNEGIDKYWSVSIHRSGLTDIQVSSRQISSLSGPSEFYAEYLLQNGSWNRFTGGWIWPDVNSFDFGTLNASPVADADLWGDSLHVRWRLASDYRLDGAPGISAQGTSRIDEILITGINTNATRLEVWPGDTDQNGTVQAEDVLGLGTHWLRSGPKAVYSFLSFNKRPVESWIPVSASYADANGDGIVNHLDLQPIGLNFGDVVATNGSLGANGNTDGTESSDPPSYASMALPKLMQGDSLVIHFENDGQMISGVAGVVRWTGGDASLLDWQWDSDLLPGLARSASPTPLEFMRVDKDGRIHFAETIKRPLRDQSPELLGRLVVRAKADIGEGMVVLERLSVSNVKGEIVDVSPTVVISMGLGTSNEERPDLDLPSSTRLLPAYPNPFNPETIVAFELAQAGQVQISVYNLLGQRVGVLLDGQRSAGLHETRLNAGQMGLSSGIYLVQLRTNRGIYTQTVTLAK